MQTVPRQFTVRMERLEALGINRRRIRELIGLSAPTVSQRIHGHRPWRQREIDAILAAARERDGKVGYEDLFVSLAGTDCNQRGAA